MTNVGQDVAVKVSGVQARSLSSRGDVSYYNLYCRVSKTKTAKTLGGIRQWLPNLQEGFAADPRWRAGSRS